MKEFTEETFIEALLKREPTYQAPIAHLMYKELLSKPEILQNAILEWIKTGKQLSFEEHGWSTKRLMKERCMNYMAAIFTIDWLQREPEIATIILSRGIR